jgi:hypothetical protein
MDLGPLIIFSSSNWFRSISNNVTTKYQKFIIHLIHHPWSHHHASSHSIWQLRRLNAFSPAKPSLESQETSFFLFLLILSTGRRSRTDNWYSKGLMHITVQCSEQCSLNTQSEHRNKLLMDWKVNKGDQLDKIEQVDQVHCTALHCTALHCTALHCTTLHCTALHCTAPV